MKKPFFYLTLTVWLYGCFKGSGSHRPIRICDHPTRNIDTLDMYIQGTWKWAEEYHFNRITGKFEYLTPFTEGYSLRWKFNHDTAFLRKNNEADSVFQFRFIRFSELTYIPTDTIPILAFYSFYTGKRQSAVPILICENNLITQHQYVSSDVGQGIWIRR
jgi:hypothetical protein